MPSTRDSDYRESLLKLRGELFPEDDRKRRESPSSGKTTKKKKAVQPHSRWQQPELVPRAVKPPKSAADKQKILDDFLAEKARQPVDESPKAEQLFPSTWENFTHHRSAILETCKSSPRCPLYRLSPDDLIQVFQSHMDSAATSAVFAGDTDSTFPPGFVPPRPSGIVIFNQSDSPSKRTSRDALAWDTDTFDNTVIAFMSKKIKRRGNKKRLTYTIDVMLTVSSTGVCHASTPEQARIPIGASERRLAALFLNTAATIEHKVQSTSEGRAETTTVLPSHPRTPRIWRFDHNTPRVALVKLAPGEQKGRQREFAGYSHPFTVNEFYRNQACGPGLSERRRVKVKSHIRGKGTGYIDDRPIIYRYR